MRRVILLLCLASASGATRVFGQDATPATGEYPLWFDVLAFVVSLPYTLYQVFVEGEQMHLLPAPLIVVALVGWSFVEWRRQGFWTPRIVHIMAVLGLATIVLINVDWVMSGGEMWTQRYVVIAIFGLFPYVAYLAFLGPKFIGRKRAPKEQLAADGMAFNSPDLSHSEGWSQPAKRSVARPLAYLSVGVVGVAGLAFLGARRSASPGPIYMEFQGPEVLAPNARGVEKGDPDAEVTVVIFGDYQCPACGAFATRSMPQLEEAYLDTGRARFIYYDLPLTSIHDNAFDAARAAHCAEDQGAFWAYHGALYSNQAEWSPLALPNEAFIRYATDLELDTDDFRSCVEGDRHKDLVEANGRFASALNIHSTPRILILADGARAQRAPRYTFEVVQGTIESVLASAAQ